jgi:hypothetical protein
MFAVYVSIPKIRFSESRSGQSLVRWVCIGVELHIGVSMGTAGTGLEPWQEGTPLKSQATVAETVL